MNKGTRKISVVVLVVIAVPIRALAFDAPSVAGFDRFFRGADSDLEAGGRLLISELSCTACHTSPIESLQPKPGPNLEGAGHRLPAAWLSQYLANPQSVKPGSTMPDLLHALPAKEKKAAIGALVAFLSTQQAAPPDPADPAKNLFAYEFWKKGNRDRGRQLYHRIGCVACHEPDADYEAAPKKQSQLEQLLSQLDPEEIEEMGLSDVARPVRSIPHGDVTAKYSPKTLTEFLLDPQVTRPGGRMPSLKLKPNEAADVAAYLLQKQADPPLLAVENDDAALVAKGQQLFNNLGCAHCHTAKGGKPARESVPLARLDANSSPGCLASSKHGLPRYDLDETQRRALESALATQHDRSKPDAPPTEIGVDLTLLKMNCYACHDRDKRGGVGPKRKSYFETGGHVDMGDEGRLPPSLDGVGRKLHSSWLVKVFKGTGDVRPHMLARMPIFPDVAVKSLPKHLAAEDGQKQPSEGEVFGDTAKLAEGGRRLMDTGCVQCHPLRGESLPGVKGVDLADISGRIHPQWFHDFLLDPARLKPRTRMPTFFPNGRSSNQLVLDGDVSRQIAALWTYLKQNKKQKLPDKLIHGKSHDFELRPNDRPILLRTFMKQAGPQAIAVGFPQKVHVAFDTEQVRLAMAWRGRFLDAHGTWFDRFSPPAAPLGDDLIEFPPGVPLARLNDIKQHWPAADDSSSYRFGGYRLDRGGVPTMLYRFDRFDVTDRLEPADGGKLHRQLRLIRTRGRDIEKPTIWFRAAAGPKLTRNDPASVTTDNGLTIRVPKSMAARGELRNADGVSEWIVPVVVSGETMIEVFYEW